tara:strand:+ start:28 stop:1170 length:1143 start_codon:yes stop_codon:yes gene_type:complete
MPSVSLTNAFDITNLDVDVNLTLSGFSNSCNGAYLKTTDKTWKLGSTREIVYIAGSFDASPHDDIDDKSRWVLRDAASPFTVFFIEHPTSAAGHPTDVVWSKGDFASPLNSPLDATGTTVGTVAATTNQDIGGSADIRKFTNLTSLNFSQFGLTSLTGDVTNKDLTYVNLSGNSISKHLTRFPFDSVMEEFIITDNDFFGQLERIPGTTKFIDISGNLISGAIPALQGNTVIEKFIAQRTDLYNSPNSYAVNQYGRKSVLFGNVPNLEGCTNLTHFDVSGNGLVGIDINFQVPSSIIHFDVSNNSLTLNTIKLILKAFNQTFHLDSPQTSVAGQGRTINVSGNYYNTLDSPDILSDNSPGDSYSLGFKSNLESLGWTVTI